MVSRPQEVSTDAEEILHDTVNRREPLELSGRLETPHLALTLSGRLMGGLRAVVRVLIGAVKHRWHHRATGGRVTTQLVGNQASRHVPLVLQQLAKESHRGVPIPSRLHEDVEDVTVLIHGAPQVLLATLDRDEHLVEMPGVSEPATSAPQSARILRTEPSTPLPDGLIGDFDTPAGQQVLHVSEAEREAVSRPGELHPQPLVERYVNLSAHTAPIRRTHLSSRSACLERTNGFAFIRISSWRAQLDTDKTARRRPFAPSPLQRLHHYYERLRPSASHRYSGSCGVAT